MRRPWAVIKDNPRWVQVVFALLFIVGTALFFGRTRANGAPFVRIGVDGRYYWAYLTSLALDGDLDFTNQYANPRSGNYYGYGKTPTGHYSNVASIGPALAWMPAFVVAHAVSRVIESPAEAADGTSDLTQVITLYSSFLMAFAAMLLAYSAARRHFGPGPACAGAVAGLVAGPVVHYAINQPYYAHAPSALAVTALLWEWDRRRGVRTLGGWAILGALLGVAMLMRTQNFAFVLPIVFEACADLLRGARRDGVRGAARALVGPLAAAAASLLAFLPQMYVWKVIYGRWVGVPTGSDYIRWGASSWAETLFASRNGLFPWAPLWMLGIIGLLFVARRDRMLGLGLLATFALTAYMNGAFWHWWGMGSFGGRRYDGMVVHVALGYAALVALALAWMVQRPRLTAGLVIGAFTAAHATCVTMMAHDYQAHIGPQPDSTDMLARYDRAATLVGRQAFALGNPFSWPAPWFFAWRTGAPAARYEAVVGPMLLDGYKVDFQTVDPKLHTDVWLTDANNDIYLVGAFLPPRGKGREALRPLRAPGGRLLLPLNVLSAVGVKCSGVGSAIGQLVLRWNGDEVARAPLMPGAPLEVAFVVPAERVERELNLLDFTVEGVAAGSEALGLSRCGLDASR